MNKLVEALTVFTTIAVLLFLGFLFVAFVDFCASSVVPCGTARVHSKMYVPPSVRFGTAFGPKNEVYHTTDYEPEKWIVVIQKEGKSHAIHCTSAQWTDAKEGDDVNVSIVKGHLFNHGYRLRTQQWTSHPKTSAGRNR